MPLRSNRGCVKLQIEQMAKLPKDPTGRTGWPWAEGCVPLPGQMEDGRQWPRISVVTPSYNQGRFLEQTIRSVLLQGYPNLEYIVVDGGSTDGSVEIIRRYEKSLAWWVSEPDRGQSHAINKGFARATGEILAWLNSDDYYLPGVLATVARAWRDSNRPAALVGRGMSVTEDGVPIHTSPAKELTFDAIVWWCDRCLFQSSCFFPAQAYRAVGGVDEQLHYAMDMDLWLKLIKVVPFRHVDGVLSAAHRHSHMKTYDMSKQFFLEMVQVQIRHGRPDVALAAVGQLYDRYEYCRSEWDRIVRRLRPLVNNPIYRALRPLLRRRRAGTGPQEKAT